MKKVLLILGIIVIIVGISFISYRLGQNSIDKEQMKTSNKKITYTINNDLSYWDDKFSERGVYYNTFNQPNSPHLYTIAMGEMPSGGNSIKIKEVHIDDNKNVEVIVEEQTSGSVSEYATQAFTYPICRITLDEIPNTIIVKNAIGEEFKHINFI